MTYALILVKGKSHLRDKTLKLLSDLKDNELFEKNNNVDIVEVFISFGWPDIILLIKGKNVEVIKLAIVRIRDRVFRNHKDTVETSTIICTTLKEIEKVKRENNSN